MKKHFTLTEILVVVFLIGVLTAIGFGMYSYAMNSAKESGTRALLTRLEAALETCNTKFGYLPPTRSSGSNAAFKEIRIEIDDDGMVTSLCFDENEEVSDDYLKEFLRTVDAENLKKNLQQEGSNDYYVLIDGWGNKIYYAYPGKFNKTGYDLYSAGADGRMGSSATGAATASALGGASITDFKDSSTNEVLCDDIFNF
ncbi:type II secretion system protein GspG [uncultured Victivallis sp.]|uniref:type II secretion system protein GspG n=1 Tax=uncultured Victivallis sp. TaxID=354118 RepID=UPI0025E4E298|nr:type II secretion system protein GspG [uncultured Victivallis sp.]